ncbi:T9SS type A sorting domain-containing protein [candidate division WOR-3 bacterium]|nr:T9SS type A sorting domain-containing protein [candidate division WOR-3 bacterium]
MIIKELVYTVGNKLNKLLQHLLICCLLPTAYSLLLYAYPLGWSDDILLTPEDDMQRSNPDLDVDTYNNVWAVWDSGTWVNNTAEILYSKRDSLGDSLIPETNISSNVPYSHLPRVAVDASNNIQFIWREASSQGLGIGHTKLANDGTVIVSSHLAVSGAGGGSSSLRPEMVLNKYNEINIIWDESPSGYNQMNYTKLDTLGNPIIAKIRVSLENIYVYWPGIGVDSFANNHMAYRSDSGFQDRLTYTKLDKDGNILIDNKILDTGLLPTIIADRSQNIHMVYPHPTGSGWSIEYLKLSNNGSILIFPKTISIHERNMSPHMAMDSLQYLHVVWPAESSGVFPIMYTKLDTLGNFIIPPMQVVYPPYTVRGGGMPRIAIDPSNKLHLVWVDDRLNPLVSTDIYYKRGENENTVEETALLKTANLTRISVFPNPFSKATKISFGKEQSAEGIELKIYDVSGRLVRQWDYPTIRQSDHIIWDGTDDSGNHLPAGVYFIHFSNCPNVKSIPVVTTK